MYLSTRAEDEVNYNDHLHVAMFDTKPELFEKNQIFLIISLFKLDNRQVSVLNAAGSG